MELVYVIVWIALSIIVGAAGKERTTGFFLTFIFSVLLSPIVGAFVVFSSERLSDIEHRRQIISLLREIANNRESGKNMTDENYIQGTDVEDTSEDEVSKPTAWQRIKYGL